MQNLKILMENGYRKHPAFTFDAPNWYVPAEMMAVFNDTYVAARQFASTLGTNSRAAT